MIKNLRSLLLLASGLFLYTGTSSFAAVNDEDRKLNQNLDNNIPVYCSVKRLDHSFWISSYEFALSLENAVNATPKPKTTFDRIFLGYANRNSGANKTLLRITCNIINETTKHVERSELVGEFPVEEKQFTVEFQSKGDTKFKAKIEVNITETTLDIGIEDSGPSYGLFMKKYGPRKIYFIDWRVK
jgi:hypothetical protein